MTRKEVELLDRANWKCLPCQQAEADTQDSDPAEETEGTYRKSRDTLAHKLKILQYNIDSLRTNQEELRVFLQKHKVDVFALQETKLIAGDDDPKIPGYTLVRKDRKQKPGYETNRGGGLLMGVRNKIPFHPSELNITTDSDTITEAQTIEIPLANSEKIRLTNIYVPPVRSTAGQRNQDSFDASNWPHEEFDLIIGDTNAHSSEWDASRTDGSCDRRGELIETRMDEKDMTCINTKDKPTHINFRQNPTTFSSPDTSISHVYMLDKLKWDVVNDMRSDHQPILIEFDCQVEEVNNTPKYKWRFNRADWKKFGEGTDRGIPTYYRKLGINRLEKKIRKSILRAAQINIGRKKVDNKSNPFFTKEIKEAINERNRLKKTIGTTKEAWMEASERTKEMIREEKSRRWKEYIEGIDPTTSPTEIWRTIRNLDGRRKPSRSNEVLEVDNVYYVNDIDKAKQFVKTYKGFAKLPVRREDRAIRRRNRLRMKAGLAPLDENEGKLTMEELDRVIDEAKNNKAAGEDDIPYEFLKHLGPRTKEALLYLYQRVWEGGEIPTKWRTAIIHPMLKDGKDPKLTVSFRPISLTSCVGKVLEKIVADRLMYVLEKKGALNDSQAGFRQGRCTTDQVLKLVQQATDQFHTADAKHSSRTIATFFDYEKAYDKVWRDGLITKMLDLGIPQRFIKYVRHFLSGRKTQVEVNGARSPWFRLDEGLPQGSAISPLLFLIFINDIDVDLDSDTTTSLFADDTAAWVHDGKIRGSSRVLMQGEIDKILQWARKWKMRVNTSKTKTLVLSTANGDLKWDPELTGNGAPIDPVREYRFLGVTADGGLRFSKHVDNIIDKCKCRVNILRCMAGKDWGNSVETQRTVYLQLTRSTIEFSAPSWSSWASDTNIKRLQVLQNQAMRAITGQYKTCPIDFLHCETKLVPLKLRFQQLDDITWDRYARLPTEDSRSKLLHHHAPPKNLVTRHGWRNLTAKRMADWTIPRETATPPLAPWFRLENITVERAAVEKKKEAYSQDELYDLAMQKIRSVDCAVHIYTDGSTNTNQEGGGAGVYAEDDEGNVMLRKAFPAGALSSSYSAEAVAMLQAVRWIEEAMPLSCLICTDSMSLVDAIDKNNWKDPDECLKQIKTTISRLTTHITLLWIPSHCGIPGNDEADELAKQGSDMPQDNVGVSHKSVKAKILARKWEIKHPRAKEMYGERRGPKMEVEKAWPRSVRSLYGRLRTEHSMDLAYYRYKLDKEEDPYCTACGEEYETTRHLLCSCPALSAERHQQFEGESVQPSDLVQKPEKCRVLLSKRFKDLDYKNTVRSPQA